MCHRIGTCTCTKWSIFYRQYFQMNYVQRNSSHRLKQVTFEAILCIFEGEWCSWWDSYEDLHSKKIFRKIFQELSRRQCDLHSTASCGTHDWVRYRFGSLQMPSQNRNQWVIYWYSIVQSRAVKTWSRTTWYYKHHSSDRAKVYITILNPQNAQRCSCLGYNNTINLISLSVHRTLF